MSARDYDAEIDRVNDLIAKGAKKSSLPDYDAEFEEAIAQWRSRYSVQEDDAIMLLLQLFRIHQDHWDGIRNREMVGATQFKQMVSSEGETVRMFQESVKTVTYELRDRKEWTKRQAIIDGIGVGCGPCTLFMIGIGIGILLGKHCF
jgi:hypothetical protein